MKKIKHFSLGLISGVILATGVSVFAEDGLQKIEAYLRPSLPITLDGKKIALDNPPVMYDGSTYLKLRDVTAITGMGVNWNEETQTVELTSNNGVKQGSGNTSGSTPNDTTPSSGKSLPNEPITDLEQLLPILNKEHDVSYDKNSLTITWNMTAEEYSAYASITSESVKHGYCFKVYQYSTDKEVRRLSSDEELRLKMNIYYNSKLIATFMDKPLGEGLLSY